MTMTEGTTEGLSEFDPQATITELPNGPQPQSDADDDWDAQDPSDTFEDEASDFAEPHLDDGRQDDEEGDVPEEFPEELRQDFIALSQGRRLYDTSSFFGHEYVVQTLTVGELIDVGLLHKEYAGTLADTKAYQAAIAAASVVRVDGESMPVPPVTSSTEGGLDPVLLDRFKHIRTRWFPPLLDHVYERFLLLDQRVQKVIEAMGNPSG